MRNANIQLDRTPAKAGDYTSKIRKIEQAPARRIRL
jgi:hypothetical protein